MRQKTFTNNQILNGILKRADHLKENEHFATAQNYMSCARSFGSYIRSRDNANVRFTFLTVQDYSRYLLNERRVLRNTQSFYLRFLRATFTAMGGSADLFQDAYTKVEPTRKRALPANVIRRLEELPLQGRNAMWRDLFLFSFAARGMAFVDMAYLRRSDISDGYIAYRRHTWATQAYHAGIPVSVISEGMGHSTEKVTRIYLAQLTPTIIDRYNHTLLHSIGFR